MKVDLGVIKDFIINDTSVSVIWNPLKPVPVVVEPHAQALEDTGLKFRQLQFPLLAGISAEKGIVALLADKAYGLVLERAEICDTLIVLRGDNYQRLGRRKLCPEQLIDERYKPVETAHIIPDAFIAGMENMETVNMQHYAAFRFALGIAVASGCRTHCPPSPV